MNRIAAWIKKPRGEWVTKLRGEQRDKRVERLGGYPQPGPQVPVEHFDPALGQAERLRRIRAGVSELGAESVDEATGHALDRLITAQGDEWSERLRQQQQTYEPAARSRLGEAAAIVWQRTYLYEQDLTRLRHTEIAVEDALLALSGHEPEPSRDSAADGGPPRQETAREQAAGHPRPADGPEPQLPQGWADWPGVRATLAPPKVSRSELRRMLDPQDGNRVPRWGSTGFRDATLLAGRPWGAYLHIFALLLAAGADVGAFTQTVELVLPQQAWVDWLVVSGLTVVVLYLAHMVGVMLREMVAARPGAGGGRANRERGRLGRISSASVCTAIWLAVGGLAFWVRYTVPLPVTPQIGGGTIGGGATGGATTIGGGTIGGGAAVSGATSPGGHPLQAAAIFLALYLATGLVAMVGAYFTHNPYRGRYAVAIRAYRKASERAAASAYQLSQAMTAYTRQQAEITAAGRVLDAAQEQNDSFTGQLKQDARVQIAGLAKDPAVTDAYFAPDGSS